MIKLWIRRLYFPCGASLCRQKQPINRRAGAPADTALRYESVTLKATTAGGKAYKQHSFFLSKKNNLFIMI